MTIERQVSWLFAANAVINWTLSIRGIVDPTGMARAFGGPSPNYPFLLRLWSAFVPRRAIDAGRPTAVYRLPPPGGAPMIRRTVAMTRRAAGKLILALPVAAPALARDGTDEKPTPQAECIAAQEPGLSDAERATLKKSITGFDKAVQAVRDFKVPADVPPAVRFAALKSRRRS